MNQKSTKWCKNCPKLTVSGALNLQNGLSSFSLWSKNCQNGNRIKRAQKQEMKTQGNFM